MHTLPNLPASIAREVFASLCSQLPTPEHDTPEARASRDDLAMAAVAALCPADAFEALQAAEIVAAKAHARDSLRVAALPGQDPAEVRRCRAQANSMMRQSESTLRSMRRERAAREKAEAAMHPAAMERAGWWFRDASVPLPEPVPAQGDRAFADLDEVEQYAVLYPDRAAQIRAHGGLPPRWRFDPMEPDRVAAIVTSTSPILLALDQPQDAVAAE